MKTDEEFVRIWQGASSPAEVAEACQIEKQSAQSRAMMLRRLGVPLKKFSHLSGRPRRSKKDVGALKALAESLAK